MAVTTTTTLTQAIMEVYSREVLFQAQPLLRFEQFVAKKTELGRSPGQVVNFTRYSNLAPGGQLNETEAIRTQQLAASQVQITVAEFGNAVAVSDFLLRTSFLDVMQDAARLLGMDYARVRDSYIRDVFLSAANVLYAGGRTARNQIQAQDVLTSREIKDAVEVLATNNAPKFNNDAYICFIHPHHARKIRDDATFQNALSYGRQYAGEIGRIDDVIFIETTQMPVLAGAGANGQDVYQAVMFGMDPVGLVDVLTVEMRDGGVEDFGRIHKLAWYAIWGAGILEPNNIIRIETA